LLAAAEVWLRRSGQQPEIAGETEPIEDDLVPSDPPSRYCGTRGDSDAQISEDIRLAIWEKFVFLVGLSATTATMRVPIGRIRANPQSRAFLLDLMREVVAVGRAHGVPLPEDYAEQRLEFADGVSPEMTSSMHHDLERGNRLEVRWLSGGVVELGEQVGVATPLNRAVADVLSVHAGGRPGH